MYTSIDKEVTFQATSIPKCTSEAKSASTSISANSKVTSNTLTFSADKKMTSNGTSTLKCNSVTEVFSARTLTSKCDSMNKNEILANASTLFVGVDKEVTSVNNLTCAISEKLSQSKLLEINTKSVLNHQETCSKLDLNNNTILNDKYKMDKLRTPALGSCRELDHTGPLLHSTANCNSIVSTNKLTHTLSHTVDYLLSHTSLKSTVASEGNLIDHTQAAKSQESPALFRSDQKQELDPKSSEKMSIQTNEKVDENFHRPQRRSSSVPRSELRSSGYHQAIGNCVNSRSRSASRHNFSRNSSNQSKASMYQRTHYSSGTLTRQNQDNFSSNASGYGCPNVFPTLQQAATLHHIQTDYFSEHGRHVESNEKREWFSHRLKEFPGHQHRRFRERLSGVASYPKERIDETDYYGNRRRSCSFSNTNNSSMNREANVSASFSQNNPFTKEGSFKRFKPDRGESNPWIRNGSSYARNSHDSRYSACASRQQINCQRDRLHRFDHDVRFQQVDQQSTRDQMTLATPDYPYCKPVGRSPQRNDQPNHTNHIQMRGAEKRVDVSGRISGHRFHPEKKAKLNYLPRSGSTPLNVLDPSRNSISHTLSNQATGGHCRTSTNNGFVNQIPSDSHRLGNHGCNLPRERLSPYEFDLSSTAELERLAQVTPYCQNNGQLSNTYKPRQKYRSDQNIPHDRSQSFQQKTASAFSVPTSCPSQNFSLESVNGNWTHASARAGENLGHSTTHHVDGKSAEFDTVPHCVEDKVAGPKDSASTDCQSEFSESLVRQQKPRTITHLHLNKDEINEEMRRARDLLLPVITDKTECHSSERTVSQVSSYINVENSSLNPEAEEFTVIKDINERDFVMWKKEGVCYFQPKVIDLPSTQDTSTEVAHNSEHFIASSALSSSGHVLSEYVSCLPFEEQVDCNTCEPCQQTQSFPFSHYGPTLNYPVFQGVDVVTSTPTALMLSGTPLQVASHVIGPVQTTEAFTVNANQQATPVTIYSSSHTNLEPVDSMYANQTPRTYFGGPVSVPDTSNHPYATQGYAVLTPQALPTPYIYISPSAIQCASVNTFPASEYYTMLVQPTQATNLANSVPYISTSCQPDQDQACHTFPELHGTKKQQTDFRTDGAPILNLCERFSNNCLTAGKEDNTYHQSSTPGLGTHAEENCCKTSLINVSTNINPVVLTKNSHQMDRHETNVTEPVEEALYADINEPRNKSIELQEKLRVTTPDKINRKKTYTTLLVLKNIFEKLLLAKRTRPLDQFWDVDFDRQLQSLQKEEQSIMKLWLDVLNLEVQKFDQVDEILGSLLLHCGNLLKSERTSPDELKTHLLEHETESQYPQSVSQSSQIINTDKSINNMAASNNRHISSHNTSPSSSYARCIKPNLTPVLDNRYNHMQEQSSGAKAYQHHSDISVTATIATSQFSSQANRTTKEAPLETTSTAFNSAAGEAATVPASDPSSEPPQRMLVPKCSDSQSKVMTLRNSSSVGNHTRYGSIRKIAVNVGRHVSCFKCGQKTLNSVTGLKNKNPFY